MTVVGAALSKFRPWKRLRRLWRSRRLARAIARDFATRERVDRLLARIAREGIDALPPADRRFLYRASHRYRKGAPRDASPTATGRTRASPDAHTQIR